jgi:ribosome-associated toxin RatA of RatAB toxin-antitoxin module
MSKVTRRVSVKADPRTVMDYVSDVSNHPAFISALQSVENLSGDPCQPGTTWEWTFVMAGIEIRGRAETAECVPGKRFSFRTTSGIESTFTYSVEPENHGVRLTIDVDYEVPSSVLAKLLDRAVVERMNEAEADRAAHNIKAILEP